MIDAMRKPPVMRRWPLASGELRDGRGMGEVTPARRARHALLIQRRAAARH
jgi:hypothetical protein